MKKISRIILLGTIIVLFSISMPGCGAAMKEKADGMEMGSVTNESGATADDVFLDMEEPTVSANGVKDNRKIIETIELTVETKEFDKLMAGLEKQIAQLGGYVENSRSYGKRMDSEDNRSAEMTIRVPAEKSGDFSDYMEANSVVVNRSVNTEDITLEYVDMESRVAALQAEKEALEKLLKNAQTVEEIISVRDKLTEVIYEIESYESQLRTYDNLVSYATVNIWIEEVERTTVVEKQGAWQKIGNNLKNNFADMWDGVVAVFVFLISAIPYLLPFAVIAAVVLFIIFGKKKRKKKE